MAKYDVAAHEALKAAARGLRGLAGADEQIEAWRLAHALRADRETHKNLSGLYTGIGRPGDAVPHIRWLAEQTPGEAWLMRTLAVALSQAGRLTDAIEAWLALEQLAPLDEAARVQFGQVLIAAGDRAALAALADRYSTSPLVWQDLAKLCELQADPDAAIAALDRVLELAPESMDAFEDRDELRHRRRLPKPEMTIAVWGNCQAVGVAQALRRLAPGARVVSVLTMDSHHFEAESKAAYVRRADLVLGQPITAPEHPYAGLAKALGDRYVAYPRIAFTGLHPDVFIGSREQAPMETLHSRIVAAAYTLGLPAAAAAALFNSYVYRSLGYLEAFSVAERLLLRNSADLDLTELLPRWKADIFMFIPNHPKINVLHDMARAACDLRGLALADTAPPEDFQARRMIWPVYPELAEAHGLDGSLTFTHGVSSPGMSLQEMIERFYDHYSSPASSIVSDPQVLRVAAQLEAIGV